VDENNICTQTDSYKPTHWPQYPDATQKVYSYFESRGGKFPTTLAFGMQAKLKKHFVGKVLTQEKIDEAYEIYASHFGNPAFFNLEGWQRMLKKHGGYLPLSIKAVPEGTEVPVSNVLYTVENTDVEFPWLTNYVESILVQLWYPMTVATQSLYLRRLILKALEKSGDPALVDFKLHDFGYRGVTCPEQAMLGGMAHLVSFKGTDTVPALIGARKYYGEKMAGFSIPASEHSTMTSWGRDGEGAAYENMLDSYPEDAMIACVSDSFNVFEACEKLWGTLLRDKINKRRGTLVIRPDSGDPLTVVPQVLNILAAKFGATKNEKGYKVLSPRVRVIQGDGVSYESLPKIMDAVMTAGFSMDNLAFGSGGALLQKMDRDTQKCAFKAACAVVDGVARDVYKDPITDPGKKSKAGKLKLVRDSYGYTTAAEGVDVLQEVFYNGELVAETTFAEIRDRAKKEEKVHAVSGSSRP
jgi:nicotinamide phosphoribosyltransferase